MQRTQTICLIVLSTVALAVALIYTKTILIPFTFAILFSFMLDPVLNLLQVRFRFPRLLSLLMVVSAATLVLSALCLLVAKTVQSSFGNIDIYEANLRAFFALVFEKLDSWGLDTSAFGREQLLASLNDLPILSYFKSFAGTLFSFVANLFLILIFVAFLITGRSTKTSPSEIFLQIKARINTYLITKVCTSAATAIITFVILSLLGIDMAIMFGIFAFLLNFIPNIGSIIAVILPIPVALVQSTNPWIWIGTLILPGMTQVLIGNVIEPKFMEGSLGLHPITILIALMFWGLIWGVPGMFIAVPLTVVLQIFLESSEGGKSVAHLMAGKVEFA